MTRRRFALALMLAPLTVRRATAQESGFGGGRPEERYYSVEVGLRDGGSTAEGYVHNRSHYYALRVGLLLEPLDAAGRPLPPVMTDVRDVPARYRTYFRTPVPSPAASIRGRVVSYDWAPRGGGGM